MTELAIMESPNMKNLNTVQKFCAALFMVGLILLFWAVVMETIKEAPVYAILASISAMILISSTFLAALYDK